MVFLVLAALAGQAEAADTITNPVWADQPTRVSGSRFYPQALADDGRGGSGVLTCRAGPKGELKDCSVDQETPLGLGIGKALLDVAPHYRLRPTAADGRPVVGRPVRFRVGFRAPIIAVRADKGWQVQQDPYGWDFAYPNAALAAGLHGEATVECKGAKGKKKVTCTVLNETPEGHGFGHAALTLQSKILAKPPPTGVDPNDRALRTTVIFQAPKPK